MEGGKLWYAFKATAKQFTCSSPTLPDGSKNIANLGDIKWAIQSNRNNIILTEEGDTIPKNYFDNDGIIEFKVVWYKQVNGSGGAFDIESAIITMFENDDKLEFGVDYANRGLYRGRDNVVGVHVTGVGVIHNFSALLEDRVIAYNKFMSKFHKQSILKS